MQIQCHQCGAEIQLDEKYTTAACPFCGSSSVVERHECQIERPKFAIGFAIHRDDAIRQLRQWIQSERSILSINMDFVLQALEREIKGIYLPAYILGGEVNIDYSAEIGENYTEKEEYIDSEGKTQSRITIQTEWRPLNGKVSQYLPDILVTGSKGVQNSLLEQIEPYDYTKIRRFDARLTAGWMSEVPTRCPDEVRQLAVEEARGKITGMISEFLPGDSQRDVSCCVEFDHISLDMIQVPIWSVLIPRGKHKSPIHLLVNGQTGKVGGTIPNSSLRVGLLALVIIGIIIASLLKLVD